ncbi:MAG: hypothetical protein HYX42_00040 [Polaromonas sp.]|uniref:hypothetical protein n=1 Tax=Polaromonas sp. TaxID=1869339 RepID=UPI0025D43062|nr:hypothetical protein [Polaromonas sp.]MBI2724618.1 hypothetical protein [Polaromonas sp.]
MKLCPTFKTECGTPMRCCNGCFGYPLEQSNSDGSEADPLAWWQTAGGVAHVLAYVVGGAVIGAVAVVSIFSAIAWFATR